MDKIEKFLRELDSKELARILSVLKKIRAGNVSKLDIKKLKGRRNAFRVRVGKIRIVFVNDGENIRVVFVGRRDEDTYKNL